MRVILTPFAVDSLYSLFIRFALVNFGNLGSSYQIIKHYLPKKHFVKGAYMTQEHKFYSKSK